MFPRARNNPRPHPIGGRGTNRTNYKRELVLNLKTKGVGQEELLRIRIAERSNPAVWIGEDRNVLAAGLAMDALHRLGARYALAKEACGRLLEGSRSVLPADALSRTPSE